MRVNLVLDGDAKLRFLAGHENVDIPPLSSQFDATAVGAINFDRRKPSLISRCFPEQVHEDPFEEQTPLSVSLGRIENKREEVGVTNLDARDVQCIEDVEAANSRFKFNQGFVFDDEALQCLQSVGI